MGNNRQIKKGLYITFMLLLFVGCEKAPSSLEVIHASLDAHGGINAWESTEQLSYQKTSLLYDSLGNLKQKVVQEHFNTWDPSFYAEMKWVDDTIATKVILEKGQIIVYRNDSLIKTPALGAKYRSDIMGAHYVVWQPYKLLEPDAQLNYQGIKTLERGVSAHTVQVNYYKADGSKGNTWWYYFDVENYKLLGNMVHHGTTYAYIENIAYEEKTGLSLNAERKSFRTDSLGNKKYLIAHYFYDYEK